MSINELKHPEILENKLDFLSSSELSHFNELRSHLSPTYDNITDFTLYRFLKVNSFSVNKAQKQFLEYMQWRKDKKLDGILAKLPNKIDVIRTLVPHGYHGFDLEGRPIYIEKTGKINANILADEAVLPKEDFLNSHIWGIENLMNLAHESSLKRYLRVETFTSIIDMNGLGFAHRSALHYLNQCMTLDQTYYPDFIGQLFVLNTPWVAPMMYNAAAPFVPSEIRARVHILKNVSDITQYVALDQLPREYGGTCTLHPGPLCIEEKDQTEIAQLSAAAHDDGLEKHYVHHHYEKRLECDERGGTFTWFFECDEGYDIDFSVRIVENGIKAYPKPPSRCQTNRGSVTVKGKAEMKLKWDNSFSWMHGKNIKFSAHIVQMDTNIQGLQNVI